MIPAPDFRIDISINIAEEVIRMGCATIGFAIACWAIVKIVGILVNNTKQQPKLKDTND